MAERIRPARVASVVREVVAYAITFEMKDPRITGVTVSDVEVTGDLREARVFVHVHDPERVEGALKALRKGAGWLRRKVGERVRLRHTPRLDFRFDRSLDYGARIEERLRELGLGESSEAGDDSAPPAERPPQDD